MAKFPSGKALKDKPVSEMALRILKKVKPFRQVEMAELMNLSRTYAASYAQTLLATTTADQVIAPAKAKPKSEDVAKLEVEMRATEQDVVVPEESSSTNTLNLQLARSYLKGLLANARVAKYVGQHHGDLLGQLRRVVDATSLDA